MRTFRSAHTAGLKACTTLALIALSFSACGHAAERRLLSQFFAASRLRDLTALSTLATVVFEPLRDGVITDFDIIRVAPVEGSAATVVSISAPVRVPDGRTVEKRFEIVVQRGLVTGFSERPAASPSTPRP